MYVRAVFLKATFAFLCVVPVPSDFLERSLGWMCGEVQAQPQLPTQPIWWVAQDGFMYGENTPQHPWTWAYLRFFNSAEFPLEANWGAVEDNNTILFRSGVDFTDLILVGGNNLNFGSYGGGNAKFIGSTVLSGPWVSFGGGTYYMDIPETVTHLYYDGELQTLARYPNVNTDPEDDPENEWLRMTSNTLTGLTGVLSDLDLTLPLGTWTGATAVVRNSNFQYLKPKVTFVGTNTLSLLYGTDAEPIPYDQENWGYYLENVLAALNVAGEWFWDMDLGRLYYKTANGSSPATLPGEFRAVVRERAIDCTTCDNLEFTNLDFEHFSASAMRFANCSNIDVINCNFTNSYEGINDLSNPNPGPFIYTDNTFSHMYNAGIRSGGTGSLIKKNTFTDIGTKVGLGDPVIYPGYTGLMSYGNEVDITENTFEEMGYVAIYLTGNGDENDEQAHKIWKNSIRHAQTLLNDGSGIFFDNCEYLTIEDNVIRDVDGNIESVALMDHGFHNSQHTEKSAGIYINDGIVQHLTIRRNTVSGCEVGLNLDHTKQSLDIKVIDNVLFNNTIQMNILDFSNWHLPFGDGVQTKHASPTNTFSAYGDTYSGNIMYCTNEDQRCLVLSMHWWATEDPSSFNTVAPRFGDFSNNYYYNPFSPTPIAFRTYHRSLIYPLVLPRTIEQWMAFSNELDAQVSPLNLNSYMEGPLGLAQEIADFNSPPYLWPNPDGCLSYPAFTPGDDGMDGNVLLNANTENCGLILSLPDYAPSVSGPHRLRFSIKSSIPTTVVASVNFNFPELPGKAIIVGPEARQVDLFFQAYVPEDEVVSVRPYFMNTDLHGKLLDVVGQYATITLDNVQLQACSYTEPVPAAANHKLYYNDPEALTSDPQNVVSIVVDPGCWSDVFGIAYAGNDVITLQPWESKVLYRIPIAYDIDVAEHHITTNTTWNTDMNVRGRVIVDANKTLTIDGATIRFAQSTPALPTNILVEPGGDLIVKNSAHLTSTDECGYQGMWDGIRALSYYDPQGPNIQVGPGKIVLESGATISNALAGVLLGEGSFMTPHWQFTTINWWGGTVDCRDAILLNNRYDIVAKEWVGPQGIRSGRRHIGPAFGGRNLFVNTQFLTTTPLKNPALDPIAHLRGSDVELEVYGCTFANDIGNHTESLKMGQGISGLNARMKVKPCITGNCPPGSNAQMCSGIWTMPLKVDAPSALHTPTSKTTSLPTTFAQFTWMRWWASTSRRM